MSRSLLFISILLLSQCAADQDHYYTVDDFKTVEKIDVHVHIFADRNDFYDQATEDNFRLITVALDADNNLDSVKEQYQYSLLHKQRHPESIAFATAFSMQGWDEPDWLDQSMTWLDSGINAGAVAVKIWKNIGMVYRDKADKLVMIDDARFDPIFKMIAERKITLFGHLGEPKNCWLPLDEMTTRNDSTYFSRNPQYHMFKHPELPSYEEQIAARDRMLEKNPDITFVGAHMGSLEWDVDELAKRLDRFPNMSVDLAARMGQVFYQAGEDREKVRDFFIKYQDRILYATDMGDDGQEDVEQLQQSMHDTWLRDWRFFVTDETMKSNLVAAEFRGLQLPAKVVDKIFNLNAKKWFNIFNTDAAGESKAKVRAFE
jgi:predicted TIM-barrel fold metal-dependent hydrolase